MIKVNVIKDPKSGKVQIQQVNERENGEKVDSTSPKLSPQEAEANMWEAIRLNRIIKEETAQVMADRLAEMDELCAELKTAICKVSNIKDYEKFRDEKAAEWLEGFWKYKAEKLGNKEELSGSLVIGDGVVTGITDSKLRGKASAAGETKYKFTNVFGRGGIVLETQRKRGDDQQNGAPEHQLRGWLKDGREVVLVRGK